MDGSRDLKNLAKTFQDFYEANESVIMEEFLRTQETSNLYTSLNEEKQKILERGGDVLLDQLLSEHPIKITPLVWEDIKDSDHSLVTQIKEKIQLLEDRSEHMGQNIERLSLSFTVDDYLFLKVYKSFVSENGDLVKLEDELCTYMYIKKAVSIFISSIKDLNIQKLYIFRTISIKDPVGFMKKLVGGEADALGNSWSRSSARAVAYEGSNAEEFYQLKFHGSIPGEAIDLLTTIIKNISLMYGREKEFFLKDEQLISIHKIEIFKNLDEEPKVYDLQSNPILYRS